LKVEDACRADVTVSCEKTVGDVTTTETDETPCGEKPSMTENCEIEECYTHTYDWESETHACARNVLSGVCEKEVEVSCQDTFDKVTETVVEEVHESYCNIADAPNDDPVACENAACEVTTYNYKVVDGQCALGTVSQSCERSRDKECEKVVDGGAPTEVDVQNCAGLDEPDTAAVPCAPSACATITYNWVSEETTCATNGSSQCVKTVTNKCEELEDGVYVRFVDNVNCDASNEPSVSGEVACSDTTACNTTPDNASFTYQWTESQTGTCSTNTVTAVCEKPVTVSCSRVSNADQSTTTVANEVCEATDSNAGSKPSETASCSADACATYAWTSSEGECQKNGDACEKAVALGCTKSVGQVDSSLDTSYCESTLNEVTNSKPSDVAVACGSTACDIISYTWFTTGGACGLVDSTCVQTPSVTCIKTTNSVGATVDNTECQSNIGDAPTTSSQTCDWELCATYTWQTVEGSCAYDNMTDKNCAKPVTVTCQRDADAVTTVADDKCSAEKPAQSLSCNVSECMVITYRYDSNIANCAFNSVADVCEQAVTVQCVKTTDGDDENVDDSECSADGLVKPSDSNVTCEWTECPTACDDAVCNRDPVCASSYQFVQDAPNHCCPSNKECAQTLFKNTYEQEVDGITVADCPGMIPSLTTAHASVLNVPNESIAVTCPAVRRRSLAAITLNFEVTSENEDQAFAVKDIITDESFSADVNGALSSAGVSGVTAGATTYGSLAREDGAESITYSYVPTAWSNDCDAECGSQLAKTRTVTCISSQGNSANDSYCPGTKPATEENCGLADCVGDTTTEAPGNNLETSASSLCLFACFLFMIVNY